MVIDVVESAEQKVLKGLIGQGRALPLLRGGYVKLALALGLRVAGHIVPNAHRPQSLLPQNPLPMPRNVRSSGSAV